MQPPVVEYLFRNESGRWQVGELELNSDKDHEYIASMFQFKEMMTDLSEFNLNRAGERQNHKNELEGEAFEEYTESEIGSDFTIQWGEGFMQELIAARAQMEKQAAGIPYLATSKQKEAMGILSLKTKKGQSPFF
jgi:hypothetical protein